MLPNLSIWMLDKRPIGASKVTVKPGQRLTVSFLANDGTNIAQGYKFILQSEGDLPVSSWICKVTFLCDVRKSMLFILNSDNNAGIHEFLSQYTGTVGNIDIELLYTGTEDTVITKIQLLQSIALDERTATAVENLLPGVKVVQNEFIVTTAGTEHEGVFTFDLPISNKTTLIMHINAAPYCDSPTACQLYVKVNGLRVTNTAYTIWATPEQITSTVIVPLVDIESGDNLVSIIIQSPETVSIRNERLQAIIDGKYMSNNGGINPNITAVENVEVALRISDPKVEYTHSILIEKQKPLLGSWTELLTTEFVTNLDRPVIEEEVELTLKPI